MFKRIILAIVTLFTFATPVALDASPAQAHNGWHTSACDWWIYNGSGASSTATGARNACMVNLAKRIFGTCYSHISVWWILPDAFYSGYIYSKSGGLCGQQQALYASGVVYH